MSIKLSIGTIDIVFEQCSSLNIAGIVDTEINQGRTALWVGHACLNRDIHILMYVSTILLVTISSKLMNNLIKKIGAHSK